MQESLLALLGYDDGAHGVSVALLVKPEHFSQPYQDIAARILRYRREYGRAPGQEHLDDLFEHDLNRGEAAPRLRRLLVGIHDLSRGINSEYISSRANAWVRKQTLLAAVMRAGEIIQSGVEDQAEQVEKVLYAALRENQQKVEPGTRLSDTKRGLLFLERPPVGIRIGIPALDAINFGASPKEMLLYIGPKGTGKSWFCTHMGRQGLIQGEKVLHITCEMPETWVASRYYQSLFGASWSDSEYRRTDFEIDDLKKLVDIRVSHHRPSLSFLDNNARAKLVREMRRWGNRLGSVLIKEFPSGSLTLSHLNSYLDYLDAVEHYIPTMLIVDYPTLMKQDIDNYRISIGQQYIGIRGIAADRNLAAVCPAQGQRQTLDAKQVRAKHAGEDISMVFTADNVLTYSQTPAEARMNLARLFVNYARYTKSAVEVVISQSYATGQFVLDSAKVTSEYWERMNLAEEKGDIEPDLSDDPPDEGSGLL